MSTTMKTYSTKIVAALIIIAMVLTAIGISTTTVDAAAKAPTKTVQRVKKQTEQPQTQEQAQVTE